MANFVTDNTPLPPLKSDAHPPINPTIEVDAADINGLWAALGDVRGVLATEQPVNFVAPFTGAVSRTIPSKLAEIVSVKDFGATGDGTTDDTAAIQAAITAAYASGSRRVLAPAGQYKTTAPLIGYQGLKVRGECSDRDLALTRGTWFVHSPATPGTAFLSIARDPGGSDPTGYADVVLEDFGVNGNPVNSGDGIVLSSVRILARNVTVYNFGGHGIHVTGGLINSLFDACVLRNCGGAGLLMDGTLESTTVGFHGTYFHANAQSVVLNNASDISFVTAIFEGATAPIGVQIDNSRGVHFYAPHFENNTGTLIGAGTVSQVTGLTVDGGYWFGGAASSNGYEALYLDTADQVRFFPSAFTMEKSAILRTTGNTGFVQWRLPRHVQVPLAQFATARVNGAIVAAGTKFTAISDDTANRRFVVVTGGTFAGAKPAGYGPLTRNLTDGTTVVTAYSDALIASLSFVQQLGGFVAPFETQNPLVRNGYLGGEIRLYPAAGTPGVSMFDSSSGAPVRFFNGTAAPVSGAYLIGDIVFNRTPAAGGTPGWVCTASGSPGTWKAMANLAA